MGGERNCNSVRRNSDSGKREEELKTA